MGLLDRLRADRTPAARAPASLGKPTSTQATPTSAASATSPNVGPKTLSEVEEKILARARTLVYNQITVTVLPTFTTPDEEKSFFTELCQKSIRDVQADVGMGLSVQSQVKILGELLDGIIGYGKMQPLLADDSISEVMVNGPRRIYYEKKGKIHLSDYVFRDNEEVMNVVYKIIAPLGRRCDQSCPMVDARLPDGSRVNVIIPPLALNGPTITIRKFSKRPLSVEDLIRFGAMTREMAEFLRACVKARLNIIVSGGTGSGKTTTLNTLSSFIPEDERIVTMEDSAELRLQQDHVVSLETRPPNIEGKGAVTIRDLVKNALRMRPERVVVGECRGGETLDMLQAMNTGHDGSLTTVHANSPRDACARIETMVLMAGMELPVRNIREQVASAINVIIQQSRLQDGSRKIVSIAEVDGLEDTGDGQAQVRIKDIFHWKQEGIQEGKVHGKLEPTGLIPGFLHKFVEEGIPLPANVFGDNIHLPTVMAEMEEKRRQAEALESARLRTLLLEQMRKEEKEAAADTETKGSILKWKDAVCPPAITPLMARQMAGSGRGPDAAPTIEDRVADIVLRRVASSQQFDQGKNVQTVEDPKETIRRQIEGFVDQSLIELKAALPRVRVRELSNQICNEVVGLGMLQPLLDDQTVAEVMVNGPEQVFVERKGKLEKVDLKFRDDSQLKQVISRIISPLGRRCDESCPMVDARLTDGSRVNAIIPPSSLIGPVITIRKFSKKPLTIEKLVEFGALSHEMADFLHVCVAQLRLNIVVSGGTGSGKTTTLNALSSFIPDGERIVTIEDAAELQLQQSHVVRLESRPANAEGKGLVTIRELVRNALRMRPDRIVIGECRGGESLDMLQAMNTGKDGSLTTGHANSPHDMISRLETMVMMAGLSIPAKNIREQISSAVNLIVQQSRLHDGSRKIVSVTEVAGMNANGNVVLRDLFRFEQKGLDAKGKVVGRLAPTGTIPTFLHKFREYRIDIDDNVFGPGFSVKALLDDFFHKKEEADRAEKERIRTLSKDWVHETPRPGAKDFSFRDCLVEQRPVQTVVPTQHAPVQQGAALSRLRALTRSISSPGTRSSPEEVDRFDLLRGRSMNRILNDREYQLKILAMGSKADDPAVLTPMILEAIDTESDLTRLLLADRGKREVLQLVLNDIVGFGPIQPLLDTEGVSEVMVNGPKNIFYESKGRIHRSSISFRDDAHVMHIVQKIVTPLGRRCDITSPIVDARLPDGSRVNVIIPPLALCGPTITIRKFSKTPLSVDKLVDFGALTREMARFLEACVKLALNVVVSGGTGSGKTTMLNALSGFIPEDERIVTVEDSAELQLQQDHVVSLETRPANVEGKGQVTIRDLIKNCLRMRPDRVVVGECRAGEALDMLQAMNTGHEGSLTTAHANSPQEMMGRLEVMVMMAGTPLPSRAIREQIAGAIDLVVQQSRFHDGSRRVTHITAVRKGLNPDYTIELQDLFLYQQKGLDESGRIYGDYVYTGARPAFLLRLKREEDIKLPDDVFGPGTSLKQIWAEMESDAARQKTTRAPA